MCLLRRTCTNLKHLSEKHDYLVCDSLTAEKRRFHTEESFIKPVAEVRSYIILNERTYLISSDESKKKKVTSNVYGVVVFVVVLVSLSTIDRSIFVAIG